MDNDLKIVKSSWDEGGFFDFLKDCTFDTSSFGTLYAALLRLQHSDRQSFQKEEIRLLWFIPVFMTRQKQYVSNINSEDYDAAKEKLEDAIAGIFGYP